MPSTVKSGNWSDSTVWDTGRPPINGESVTVFTGHTKMKRHISVC